mmetsp:Transcript_23106/g.48135  ORF Transcript_23106/g.48135 Transcript_23106/m.48135 type:complete len:164 (-) Transcript_23106:120-611(-)|eukprot:CAMPEP_0172444540 /NCGR_PEP_ID=MMETSP1065-20121228/4569_1 /TAXON_ID=265537 /ORGANISM="Amphiprora paludosa, Strain CCMP125" /LENGTH=163 /DNA_ID=CAMNT_0013195111 /DNA_START=43 /DNA_END=534 /DNA_ORIENTATION=-
MSASPISKRSTFNSMSVIDEHTVSESWDPKSRDRDSFKTVATICIHSDSEDDDDNSHPQDGEKRLTKQQQLLQDAHRQSSETALGEEEYSGPFISSRMNSKQEGGSMASLDLSSSYSGSVSDFSASALAELGGIFDSLEIDYMKKSDFRKDEGFTAPSRTSRA